MKTETTAENPASSDRTSNFLPQLLAPTGVAIGLVLTTVWIGFLGYQVARLFEAVFS
jgi:hypothetical protein